MDHDVRYVQIGKVEQTAKPVPVRLHHAAFHVQKIDSTTQFILPGLGRIVLGANAQQGNQPVDQPFHGSHRRSEHLGEHMNIGTHPQGKIVRIGNRPCLGEDLGKNQHDHGHHQRCIDNAGLPEQMDEQAGGKRGRQNIDQIVAQQQRTDHPLLDLQQLVDRLRSRLTVLFLLVHACTGRCGQRRLGAGKEARQQDQNQYSQRNQPETGSHQTSFSSRNARTAAGSTPFSTKDCPRPRVRMKFRLPRDTFLSCAI